MSNEPVPTPGPPGDVTMTEIIDAYEAQGYTAQMASCEDGSIKCFACGTASPANAFVMEGMRRVEGASDPADMVAIAALTCPVCGAKGTAVVPYGPLAPPEDMASLEGLHDARPDPVRDPSLETRT